MNRISFSVVAWLLTLATCFLTGCFPQANISGTYTTTVDAHRTNGPGWQGTAEVLLIEAGSSLTGNITLHHPTAGTIQIPITSGSVEDNNVVFFGHTTMPLGTVDLKFTGVVEANRIKGGMNVKLNSVFGEEHDTATLQMSKA